MPIRGDAQAFLQAAMALFDTRVQAVADDAWSAPSPCEGWDARDVVGHCVTNLRGLRTAFDGGDFLAARGAPVEGDVVAAWNDVRSTLEQALQAGPRLDTVVLRGNEVPAKMLLDGLVRDLVIHTWDLARAVGGDEELPEDLVDAATEAMADVGPEARGPGLYGPIEEAPPDADPQTRLLALSGRIS